MSDWRSSWHFLRIEVDCDATILCLIPCLVPRGQQRKIVHLACRNQNTCNCNTSTQHVIVGLLLRGNMYTCSIRCQLAAAMSSACVQCSSTMHQEVALCSFPRILSMRNFMTGCPDRVFLRISAFSSLRCCAVCCRCAARCSTPHRSSCLARCSAACILPRPHLLSRRT